MKWKSIYIVRLKDQELILNIRNQDTAKWFILHVAQSKKYFPENWDCRFVLLRKFLLQSLVQFLMLPVKDLEFGFFFYQINCWYIFLALGLYIFIVLINRNKTSSKTREPKRSLFYLIDCLFNNEFVSIIYF